MDDSIETKECGFTLIELLIAMAIGLIVLGALVSTFIIQKRAYDVQEQVTEMMQNARAAMDIMTHDLRMAGYYDPTGPTIMQRADASDLSTFVGIPYDPGQLQIIADFRGNNSGDPPDGDTTDPDERIIYAHDAGNLRITRNSQPFAENIQAFTFSYLISPGNATILAGAIRQIQLTVTARTSKPDARYSPNGGYRTFTLTSSITPKNLGY